MDAFAVALRLLVGVVLLSAGMAKLKDRSGFASALRLRPIGPEALTSLIARWLPYVECVVGVLLLVGVAPRVSGAAAVILLAVFTGWLLLLYRDPRPLGCACFGAAAHDPVDAMQLVRNALLLAAALVVAAGVSDARFSLTRMGGEATTATSDVVAAAALVATLALTYSLAATFAAVRRKGQT